MTEFRTRNYLQILGVGSGSGPWTYSTLDNIGCDALRKASKHLYFPKIFIHKITNEYNII